MTKTTRKVTKKPTSKRIVRNREDIMGEIRLKLNPRRFTEMSSKMAAIVGYIIGEKYTQPYITRMVVTSDDHVSAMHSGDIGFNAYIGHYQDVYRNWTNLLDTAGLTDEEYAKCMQLFTAKIRDV